MRHFWRHGYEASSMSALIEATGSNRTEIYDSYKNKAGLFRACLEAYSWSVVDPAFARVEADGAGLEEIKAFFEHQISLAETSGLPGPGCLMANTMVEIGPHDPAIREVVSAHFQRLNAGFRNALKNAARPRHAQRLDVLAEFMAMFAQGLWSHSRIVSSAAPLRRMAGVMLAFVEGEISK